MIVLWERQPLNREVARSIRAATRFSSPRLDTHVFEYGALKELWATEDFAHAVLIHQNEVAWQHWRATPRGGWHLAGVYKNRLAAQDAAIADPPQEKISHLPGNYLLAWENKDSRMIRVRLTCEDSGPVIQMIFDKMGYRTKMEAVK